jgi:hypothetical protein
MDNFSEWVNSPENIQTEQSALILGMKVVLEAVAKIRGAVPISITVQMLLKPITFEQMPIGDYTKIKYSMPQSEISFRTEIVMRGQRSYKRIAIVPLNMISYPEELEELLRVFLVEEYAPEEGLVSRKV